MTLTDSDFSAKTSARLFTALSISYEGYRLQIESIGLDLVGYYSVLIHENVHNNLPLTPLTCHNTYKVAPTLGTQNCYISAVARYQSISHYCNLLNEHLVLMSSLVCPSFSAILNCLCKKTFPYLCFLLNFQLNLKA